MIKIQWSVILIIILFVCSSSSKNLKKTHLKDEAPTSPVAYFKENPSWFLIYGLQKYYGTYCSSGRIVQIDNSEKHPGFSYAAFTCDECLNFKDKYLAHPIGLVFGAIDTPQRQVYLNTPQEDLYRCF